MDETSDPEWPKQHSPAGGSAMWSTPGVRRTALSLVGLLLTVSGFALWSSLTISRLGDQVVVFSRLEGHYAAAAAAVEKDASLIRSYSRETRLDIRQQLASTDSDFRRALELIDKDERERAVVEKLRAAHRPAQQRVVQLLDRIDDAGPAKDGSIGHSEQELALTRLAQAIRAEALRHEETSSHALDELSAWNAINIGATIFVFGLGVSLTVFFTRRIRRTRKQLECEREQAVHASLHDALTGLPNRVLFIRRIGEVLAEGRRNRSATALLLIDLDRFQEVNDTLGHHCGDRLLMQIGARLGGELRDGHTVARLGGDEFAVLLPDVGNLDKAVAIAWGLRSALMRTFNLEGVDLDIEGSIGVVMAGTHGDDAITLMQRSDVAMYVAKGQGKGVSVYDFDADQHTPQRLALLGQLRRGLEGSELFLEYQPKLHIATRAVVGVEALVRWQHPERGLIRPDEFVPIAEHTGLIGALTRTVMHLALAQVRTWLDSGRCIAVSVNISARNLADDQLAVQVGDMLVQHRVSPSLLSLEITESAIMHEPQRARLVLEQLATLGVRVCLDDFGAGYTSLAQLKSLPISELKIDKGFVTTMHSDKTNALIVRSIIELGHNLGMCIVAEGVETEEALLMLNDFGCDLAQGYHICRPTSARALTQWMADREVFEPGASPPPIRCSLADSVHALKLPAQLAVRSRPA